MIRKVQASNPGFWGQGATESRSVRSQDQQCSCHKIYGALWSLVTGLSRFRRCNNSPHLYHASFKAEPKTHFISFGKLISVFSYIYFLPPGLSISHQERQVIGTRLLLELVPEKDTLLEASHFRQRARPLQLF